MKTTQLLKNVTIKKVLNFRDVSVSAVESDSRRVSNGALFVCLEGEMSDGHDYVDEATKKAQPPSSQREKLRAICRNSWWKTPAPRLPSSQGIFTEIRRLK